MVLFACVIALPSAPRECVSRQGKIRLHTVAVLKKGCCLCSALSYLLVLFVSAWWTWCLSFPSILVSFKLVVSHCGCGSAHEGGLSRGWSFIIMVFLSGGLSSGMVIRNGDLSSKWSFVRVVFHEDDLSALWSFIGMVFHQDGLSSEWSFIIMVFHQDHDGLSSGWSFIRMVFHHHGLSSGSGWSFIRDSTVSLCRPAVTAQYNTEQYSTMQSSTVQNSTIQSKTVQYRTIQYYTEQ